MVMVSFNVMMSGLCCCINSFSSGILSVIPLMLWCMMVMSGIIFDVLMLSGSL